MDIPGLLGRLAGLPGAINQGLLGSMPVDPRLGLDPQMLQQARQGAGTDFAMGLVAGGNDPRTLLASRQNAQQGFRGRLIDIMREQEMARMIEAREDQQKKNDAYRATLPPEIQPLVDVAGVEQAATMELQQILAPKSQSDNRTREEKIADALTDPAVPDEKKQIIRKIAFPQQQGPGPSQVEQNAALMFPGDPKKQREYIQTILGRQLDGPRLSAFEQISEKVAKSGLGSLTPGEKQLWDSKQRAMNPFAAMFLGAAGAGMDAAGGGGEVAFDALPGK